MIERSGAVAAYIDRKALDHACLAAYPGSLDHLGIPRLSETEIASLGKLSWETYRAVRDLAA